MARRKSRRNPPPESRFKPYDTVTRELLEHYAANWLQFLGIRADLIQVIDADLSSIIAPSDKLVRIEEPGPSLAQIEMQSTYEKGLPERSLEYAVLARRRHRIPVVSVLVLLRPEADGPELTSRWEQRLPDGTCNLWFSYQVLRVWEQSVEEVLAGGLGIIPLAPLANVTAEELPGVIQKMEVKIQAEASPEEASRLWTAAYILLGLRYPPAVAAELLKGVEHMRESATYQAILDEGRVEEVKALLLRLGSRQFGKPDESVLKRIRSLSDLEQAERLTDRLLDASSWDELLMNG